MKNNFGMPSQPNHLWEDTDSGHDMGTRIVLFPIFTIECLPYFTSTIS